MPARRREARRALLPAEPERGLETCKKFGAFSFARPGSELSSRKKIEHIKLVLLVHAGVRIE
jgi:hypothetical protein